MMETNIIGWLDELQRKLIGIYLILSVFLQLLINPPYWTHTWQPLTSMCIAKNSLPIFQTIDNGAIYICKTPINETGQILDDGSSDKQTSIPDTNFFDNDNNISKKFANHNNNNLHNNSSLLQENPALELICGYSELMKSVSYLDFGHLDSKNCNGVELKHVILGLSKNDDLFLIWKNSQNNLSDQIDDIHEISPFTNQEPQYSSQTCNQIKLAYEVTSFVIHKMTNSSNEIFIIITLNSHELMIIPISNHLKNLLTSSSDNMNGKRNISPDSIHSFRRKITKGASIFVTEDINVALHIPRGELEIIRPRPLLISKMRYFLEKLDFRSAFRLVRTNRLDMNLLVDDDYQRFIQNSKDFLNAVGYNNLKDGFHIFIAEINDLDSTVASDTYRPIYNAYQAMEISKTRTTSIQKPKKDKKNIICDLFKNLSLELYISDMQSNPGLFSVFTACCIRKNPREIERVLLKIKEELDSDDQTRINTAEKSIRQIFVIVDDKHKLFRESLGTYDKNLFLMVAKRAQIDPTEIAELLKRFEECQPLAFRNANIDIYLKRFDKALKNLAISGHELALNEGIRIAKKEKKFAYFISCFTENDNYQSSDLYRKVCIEYAEVLAKSHGKLREAAIYMQFAGEYAKAAEFWEKSGQWQRAWNSKIMSGNSSEEELSNWINKMAEEKISRENFKDAAEIYKFNSNLDVGNESGKDATFKACKLGLIPWINIDQYYSKFSQILKDQLFEHLTEELIQLDSILQEIRVLAARLIVVILQRFQQIFERGGALIDEELLDGIQGIGNLPDNMSLDSASISQRSSSLGSRTSSSSKRSGKSAKSRRKAANKKYNDKPGSRSEHLGILTNLKKKYEFLNNRLKAIPELIFTCKIYDIKLETLENAKLKCKDIIKSANDLTFKIWPHYNALNYDDFSDQQNQMSGPSDLTQNSLQNLQNLNPGLNLNFTLDNPNNFAPEVILENLTIENSYGKLLKTLILTGIEVRQLERNYQRELGHRVGGLFMDLRNDLALVTPSVLTVDYQDFDIFNE